MFEIRPRHDSDVVRLCELVRVVHAVDGYPVLLQDDVRSFVVTENCLAAWVAELHGEVVGHIALHTVWSDEVAELAAATLTRSREELTSVSRLFVDPAYRRGGMAALLLDAAVRDASDRGTWPVLDVVTTYDAAIALYERMGWRRLGTIAYPMPNGQPIDEHVYAAPERV